MKKFIFVVGIATGYVLGARAGRKRYEQIAKYSSVIWNTKLVQCAVKRTTRFSKNRATELKDKAIEVIAGALKSKRTNKNEPEVTIVTTQPLKRHGAI